MRAEEKVKRCENCNVPALLHGTACGWQNSGIIINPFTAEAKGWMKERDDATGTLPNSPLVKVYKMTHENHTGIHSKYPTLIELK